MDSDDLAEVLGEYQDDIRDMKKELARLTERLVVLERLLGLRVADEPPPDDEEDEEESG